MKDIDLVKLKELAVKAGGDEWEYRKFSGDHQVIRKGSLEKGPGWRTFQHVTNELDDIAVAKFIASASPALVVRLIEQLEAAQRERDELKKEQAEHDEQIARLQGKFELAQLGLRSKTERCDKAEAELKRRDAQEPVAWAHRLVHKTTRAAKCWVYSSNEKKASEGDIFRIEVMELYAAAPAVVLPSEMTMSDAIKSNLSTEFMYGANWMREEAKALGCQPGNKWISCEERLPELGRYLVKYNNPYGDEIVTAKYIEHDFCAGSGNIHRFWLDDRSRSISAMKNVTHWMPLPVFDAAGVKWEESE